MAYITNYAIYDTKDNRRYYAKGATYPAKGVTVSDERLKALVSAGHIKATGKDKPDLMSYKKDELVKMADEAGIEYPASATKADLVALLEG